MLILASNSPRRKQLLSLGGLDFRTLTPKVDESVHAGEAPADYVLRLAQSKARAVQEAQGEFMPADAMILAADTAVIDWNGAASQPANNSSNALILGKPAGPTDAVAMLRRLRGRTHWVYTGLALLNTATGELLSELVSTEVPMRDYSNEEIRAYVATGDPLDKAGAYAIQNTDFHPVQNLQGCYANVMGLPVCQVSRMLKKLGYPPANDIARRCQATLSYPCEIYRQVLRI